MKNFFQQNLQKFLILLMTLIVLSGGIYFYEKVTIESHKELLDRKAFQSIDQVIKNATTKLDNLEINNRDRLKKAIQINIDSTKLYYQKDSILWKANELNDQEINYKNLYKSNDSASRKKVDIFLIEDHFIYDLPNPVKLKKVRRKVPKAKDRNSINLKLKKGNSIQLQFDQAPAKSQVEQEQNADYIEFRKGDTVYYSYEIDFRAFIAPLVQDNPQLDQLMLFYFDESDSSLEQVFSTFNNRVDIMPLVGEDAKKAKKTAFLRESKINTLDISGMKYRTYLQPIGGKKNKRFIVCGLMKEKTFRQRVQHIDTDNFLKLFSLIIFAFLSIPILNYIFRNEARPVHYFDIILLTIAFLGITSLSTLSLNSYFGFDVVEKNKRKNTLRQLSNSIETYFLADLNEALEKLDDFDRELDSLINLDTLDSKKGNDIVNSPLLKDQKLKNYTYQLFTMAKDGAVKTQFVIAGLDFKDYIGYSLKKRAYFDKIIKEEGWDYKEYKNCFLSEIYSYQGEGLRAVASKQLSHTKHPEDSSRVIAISFNLSSVMDAALPQGMGFALIEEDGRVMFHSDSRYTSHENFLEECDNDYHATSAIFSRHNTFFNSRYHNNTHTFYLHPIKNLPLYLVVFENENYYDAAHISIITFCLIHGLFLLAGIIILFVILHYLSRLRKTKNLSFILKKPAISPNSSLSNEYSIIIGGLVGIILYQVLYLGCYKNFTNSPDRLFLTFITVYIGVIFLLAVLYQKAEKKNYRSLKLWLYIILSLSIIIGTGYSLSQLVGTNTKDYTIAVFFLVLTILFFSGISFYLSYTNKSKRSYLTNYKFILFCFIFMSSINPALLFFNLAYQQEYDIMDKFRELYILKKWYALNPKTYPSEQKSQISEPDSSTLVLDYIPKGMNTSKDRNQSQKKYFYLFPLRPDTANFSGRKEYIYFSLLPFVANSVRLKRFYSPPLLPYKTKVEKNNIPKYNELKEQYYEWLANLRLPYNPYLKTSHMLTSQHEGLDFWYWNVKLKELYLKTDYPNRPKFWIKSNSEDYLDRLKEYLAQAPVSLVVLVIIVLVLMKLLWSVINRFIDSFTNFKPFLSKTRYFHYEEDIEENIKKGRKQVIIALPGADALELVINKIIKLNVTSASKSNENSYKVKKDLHNTYVTIDFKKELEQDVEERAYYLEQLPDVLSQRQKKYHIILHNFGFDIKNPESNRFKLRLIQKLEQYDASSITIITNTYSAKHFKFPKDEPTLVRNWHLNSSDYLKVYVPLFKTQKDNVQDYCSEFLEEEIQGIKSLENLFSSDEEKFRFLKYSNCQRVVISGQIRPPLLPIIHNIRIINRTCIENDFKCRDQLIYELQCRAGLYYKSLWESLPIDEKQLVLDLAEDGLVNIQNAVVIHRLLLKGVLKLIDDKQLTFFNKSFHSYVLLSVDRKPVISYNRKMSRSKWEFFKLPFSISLIVLFVFIMVSQQVEIIKTIPAITALATALPALFNLSPKIAQSTTHSNVPDNTA